ncbi:MAG: S1 RNA-binding domain-containing protein [Bacilli bacterium]
MNKYEKGNIIKGNVTGIENYGVFVNIDKEYNGLIHISELSYRFVRSINDFINIGETIYVKVIDIDNKNKQLKLSIKDINYKSGKNKKNIIIETKNGFNPLRNKLKDWIKNKIKEMDNS